MISTVFYILYVSVYVTVSSRHIALRSTEIAIDMYSLSQNFTMNNL